MDKKKKVLGAALGWITERKLQRKAIIFMIVLIALAAIGVAIITLTGCALAPTIGPTPTPVLVPTTSWEFTAVFADGIVDTGKGTSPGIVPAKELECPPFRMVSGREVPLRTCDIRNVRTTWGTPVPTRPTPRVP